MGGVWGVQRSREGDSVTVTDRTAIEVSLTISPVRDHAGNTIGASKIARDVTEQKQIPRRFVETNMELERALENLKHANEQLERAAQMKSEFVATGQRTALAPCGQDFRCTSPSRWTRPN